MGGDVNQILTPFPSSNYSSEILMLDDKNYQPRPVVLKRKQKLSGVQGIPQ